MRICRVCGGPIKESAPPHIHGCDKCLSPVPELRDSFPVVLYFKTDAERQDFIRLVQEAKPGLIAKEL